MAAIEPVPPAKLFVISLHHDLEVLEKAVGELQQLFGKCDWISEDFPFDVTGYYENEMGKDLFRRFYSFEKMISPEEIAEIKILTNQIEEKHRNEKGRTINLDPGYLDTYKVVLASAKFGGQKIHLRNGIYADMTLVMYKGQWEPFAWGFPDFKSRRYDPTLSKIRDLYKAQMRGLS